jgi:PAS domain-containing protein
LRRLESLVNLRSHIHPELQSEYVIFADSSRHYLDCSDGICRLLGYSRAEILNLSIEDISYRSEDVITLFEDYRRRGKLYGEYVLRHKNGQPLRITYRSFIFPDGCMAAVWFPHKEVEN